MAVGSNLPRISIVTPSLNQGRFLKQCLDSVRAQCWPNIEHFVIDGGSTDETLAILEDSRGQLTGYISEPDKGAADAINKGFAMCTGDIIAWLNADDYYLPGTFEAIASAWRKTPDAPFWFGNGHRVDESGRLKAAFNNRPMLYDRRALLEGTDYILQPSTFMNANALRQVSGLDISLRWSFDWDLWIRLAKHGQPVALEATLSATREWGETLTATGSLRRVEEIRLMVEMHSGKALTYGSLCYLFDTVLKEMNARPEEFAPETKEAIAGAWRAVSSGMQNNLPVDAGGMPFDRSSVHVTMSMLQEGLGARIARRGLRAARKIFAN